MVRLPASHSIINVCYKFEKEKVKRKKYVNIEHSFKIALNYVEYKLNSIFPRNQRLIWRNRVFLSLEGDLQYIHTCSVNLVFVVRIVLLGKDIFKRTQR